MRNVCKLRVAVRQKANRWDIDSSVVCTTRHQRQGSRKQFSIFFSRCFLPLTLFLSLSRFNSLPLSSIRLNITRWKLAFVPPFSRSTLIEHVSEKRKHHTTEQPETHRHRTMDIENHLRNRIGMMIWKGTRDIGCGPMYRPHGLQTKYSYWWCVFMFEIICSKNEIQ